MERKPKQSQPIHPFTGVPSMLVDATTYKTHHNDGVLDEGLGADQLVVAGVVHHVEDTRLARAHCVPTTKKSKRARERFKIHRTEESNTFDLCRYMVKSFGFTCEAGKL